MFLVVKFTESDEVEVIPEAWSAHQNGTVICHWPPYKSSVRFMKAVKSIESPVESWSSHEISVLYRHGEYTWLDYLSCLHLYLTRWPASADRTAHRQF